MNCDRFKHHMTEDIYYTNAQQKHIINTVATKQPTERTSIIIMEELAELSQAVSKCVRQHNDCRINLLEEMADVSLSMAYLKIMYNITDEELQQAINVKLRREKIRNQIVL